MSGDPVATSASAQPPSTVGVEEEFLLVDAAGGEPVPLAAQVLQDARETGNCRAEYKHEFLASQVEAASVVCADLGGLAGELLCARGSLRAAAERRGALLLPTGTSVLPGRVPATPGTRFARILETYAEVVADYQVCGCHVHVGVADRETAVAVVNLLRPWLPTLLALSANSPYRDGRDTGYASWRMVEQGRFPGSGVPPYFASAAAHEAELARLVDCGSLVDPQMSFWLVRPSLRFPTVEFRTADTTGTVGEALLQAALSRALVRTALDTLSSGRAAPPVSGQVAAAALWCAARHGLGGPAVHPWRAEQVPALSLVRALVDHVRPALEDAGDLPFVREQIAWSALHGTGADRRRAAGAAGLDAVVRELADEALLAPDGVEAHRGTATAPAGEAPIGGNEPGGPR